MRSRWANRNEQDQAAFRATIAFLNGRLAERATVDWALGLGPYDDIKRIAVLDRIDSSEGQNLGEPWRSAWRLIEESWCHPVAERDTSTAAYTAQHRLRAGDRSGPLVTAIVELVTPRLKVEPFSNRWRQFKKPPKRPTAPGDLFSARLTSGEIVDPAILGLGDLADGSFLISLANALDAAVTHGLDIARRIGWDGERHFWQLGMLYRVYYLPVAERANGEHEPDEFHRGIAPSVKLLHAVISRLIELELSTAIEFGRRWKLTNSPVHLRLWAALSRDTRVTPADEVGALLLSLDDRRFWNLHDFPEIAELRAKRFTEFDLDTQAAITARICRRPPRNQWPTNAEADRVKNARLYWAIRELRRIEIAGATLPPRDSQWLASKVDLFPDLIQIARIDSGFMASPKAYVVAPNPDRQFDSLAGIKRLKALESALSTARGGWDEDPAARAADWIREQGNPPRVLADLESVADGGAAFPRVWERFGWAHSPVPKQGEEAAERDLPPEASRVLALLTRLPQETVRQAIDGISNWLDSWKRGIVTMFEGLEVWLRVWPIAVEATNSKQSADEEVDLSTVARSSDEHEPMDLDTLNTPAGKLVGVFLAACPNLQEDNRPFDAHLAPRTMRDTAIAATGRSGLIAKHRMIEELPYFLRADPDWTYQHLVKPLKAENTEALALWRAIARRTQLMDVLGIIGGDMAERATDRRLGRETRRSLVFSLVIECLHALREQREPEIPYARIQQMIRSLDDEVRAYGASAIQRFVREVSAQSENGPESPLPEALF